METRISQPQCAARAGVELFFGEGGLCEGMVETKPEPGLCRVRVRLQVQHKITLPHCARRNGMQQRVSFPCIARFGSLRWSRHRSHFRLYLMPAGERGGRRPARCHYFTF